MKLVLLGPPGAGKGTQAELLKKNLELYPISTGDMLREEAKAKTELGAEAKKYMDQGKLVPDHVVIQMVSHRIKEMEEQIIQIHQRLKEANDRQTIYAYAKRTPREFLVRKKVLLRVKP